MRTITPAQFKQLPECFQNKIKVDEGLRKLRLSPVIPFEHGRKLVNLQKTFRAQCKFLIKKNNNGGGRGNVNG